MSEHQANAVLSKYWNGRLPVDVLNIAGMLGIRVQYHADLGPNSGMIEQIDGSPIIHVNVVDAPVRQRFTIAHEVGHWVLGHLRGDGHSLPRDNRTTFSMSSSWLEREANQFAAALLMPADAVSYVIQSGHATTLEELAKTFGVSKAAMQFRVNNLGLFCAA